MCVCVCVCACGERGGGGGGGGGGVKRGQKAGEHYGIVLTVMIACEQALRVTLAVGWEKEGELATTAVRLAILNICIKKVDAKC